MRVCASSPSTRSCPWTRARWSRCFPAWPPGAAPWPARRRRAVAWPSRRPGAPRPCCAISPRPGCVATKAYRLGSALKAQGTAALPALHVALEQASRPLELEVLGDVLGALGAPASIPVLSRALQRLSRGPGQDEDAGQAAVAARLHLALADLGSRIALFDLRERLEARPPQRRRGPAPGRGARGGQDPAARPGSAPRPRARPRAARRPRVCRHRDPRGAASREPEGPLPPDRQAMDALWATLRTKTPPKPRKA